jgi:hypothetical protein
LPAGGTVALIGDALRVAHLPLQSNPRCALREHVADLIASWATVALIGDVPYLIRISYLIAPMGILVTWCIIEVARIWQPYCTCIRIIQRHTCTYI